MNEQAIIEKLGKLRGINPSADFAERSKNIILSTQRLSTPKRAFAFYNLKHLLTEGVGSALSVGLVSIIAVFLLTNAPKALNPIIGSNIIPGADTTALVNDANAAVKDIDIHMQETQLFDTAAQKAGLALKETANGQAPHTNTSLIEKESSNIATPETTSATDINNILDQLIK